MASYTVISDNRIEIDFQGLKPGADIRNKMKAVKIWWDPSRKIWFGPKNTSTLDVAKEICGEVKSVPVNKTVRKVPLRKYAFKAKIKDIIAADPAQFETWEKLLKDYVNEIMNEDNSSHFGNAVSRSQESVWKNCLEFIATNLKCLNPEKQENELIFEYSIPGTVHDRPDVFLLTEKKVISLEFKKKNAPQVDDNKDDVAQAISYKEWLENHHKVTKERSLEVKSYLVCTHNNAVSGCLRGIQVLTNSDFLSIIDKELDGESKCSFIDEWLASSKTEMLDMLQAMTILYEKGEIPYISDVNKNCLEKVREYIDAAKKNHQRILILINGVPGAGKTAVGQCIAFDENKDGKPNAVYLSGNDPLVEVLQYQINQVAKNKHAGENVIQSMKSFKSDYFSTKTKDNTDVPEQSILIFDEAQRAWDEQKLDRGFSEPEGLFDVGERIFIERGFAVLVGLYGNGQVIYKGEEAGIKLWEAALKKHKEWIVYASDAISAEMQGLGDRNKNDNALFLPVAVRPDFIDYSKWVEQAIRRTDATPGNAKAELEELQNTSMRFFVTRDMSKIKAHVAKIDKEHPQWKYGILISNFAEQNVIRKTLPGWIINRIGKKDPPNTVSRSGYGPWFTGGCKLLDKACTVFGCQGLELDCPIIIFGGEYVRKGDKYDPKKDEWLEKGKWLPQGNKYDYYKNKKIYQDSDTIVENNFRVLLTRARKEMILLIPDDRDLDETYQYFVDMGMDKL